MITIKINQAKILFLTDDLKVETTTVLTDKKLGQRKAKDYVKDQDGFNKIVAVENKSVNAEVSLDNVKVVEDHE